MRTILLAILLTTLSMVALHGLPPLAAFLVDAAGGASFPAPLALQIAAVLVVLAAFVGARLGYGAALPAIVATTFVLCHPALSRCVAGQDLWQLATLIASTLALGALVRRPLWGGLALVASIAIWLAVLRFTPPPRYQVDAPTMRRWLAAAAEVYWPSSALPFVAAGGSSALLTGSAFSVALVAIAAAARAWVAAFWLAVGPIVAAALALGAARLVPERALPPSAVALGVAAAAQGLGMLVARSGGRSRIRRLALVPVMALLIISLSATWTWRQETSNPRQWILRQIEATPAEPAVVLKWAEVALDAEPDAAGRVADRLRALLPRSGAGIRELAVVRICALEREQGRPAAALSLVDEAYPSAAERPPRVASERLRSLALLDGTAFRAAVAQIDPVASAPEVCAAAGTGLLALDPGNQDAALTTDASVWLERALDRDPDLYDARVALGTALMRQGHLVESVRSLERAQRLAPGRAEAFIELARLYFMQGELEGGEQQLGRAFAIDRRSPMATFVLGKVLFDATKSKDKGLRLMKTALERDPAIPEGRRTLASCYLGLAQLELAQGFQDRARNRAEQALREQPAMAAASHLIGKLWASDGDLTRAEHYLSDAYAADPKLPDLARDLGDVLKRIGYRLFLAGDHASAKPYFERILAIRPPGIKIGAIEALLHEENSTALAPGDDMLAEQEREQRKNEARESYDRATRLIAAGDDAGGETELRLSLAALPGNPYAHFELGKLLTRRQDAAAALAELRESYALMRELRLEIPGVYTRLAEALLAADQKDEARVILALYLERFPDGEERARVQAMVERAR